MEQQQCVVVPYGTTTIEYAAFRGHRQLVAATLPETLEQICDLAFSCTSLRSLRLPARCVKLGERALRTGPETLDQVDRAYRSTIQRVEVDPENPLYCMRGALLCRRSAGGLTAVFCPGSVDEVVIGRSITTIARVAFDGTYRIGHLRVHDAVAFEDGAGLAVNATCDELVIDLAQPVAGVESLQLRMPSRRLQQRVLAATRGSDTLDVAKLCAAYDDALPEEQGRLLQAQLMAARLACPVYLEPQAERVFRQAIEPNADALCVHFGACSYWRGFDDMAQAGVLDANAVTRVAGLLSGRGDSAAATYLLDLQRRLFGERAWDYAI